MRSNSRLVKLNRMFVVRRRPSASGSQLMMTMMVMTLKEVRPLVVRGLALQA